jgi:hypothetical protein
MRWGARQAPALSTQLAGLGPARSAQMLCMGLTMSLLISASPCFSVEVIDWVFIRPVFYSVVAALSESQFDSNLRKIATHGSWGDVR